MSTSTSHSDTDECVNPIFDLMMGQYHSSTLVIFGRLRLFDFISKCSTGVTVEQLASHANWSVRATSAMLISLVTNDILETVQTGADNSAMIHSFEHGYKLTPRATKFLLSDAPGNVIDYLELFWECSPKLLLEKALADKKQDNFMLETGEGAPSKMFINAMQGQSSHAAMILSPFLASDLEGITSSLTTQASKHIVDVGGGSGTFCIEICKVLSDWKGTIYELAGVCPIADEFIVKAGLKNRVKAMPGNMFKDNVFPPAVCYGFGNVLHDWSDEDNMVLLQKAYDSLPNNSGKVLILEMLVAEDVVSTTCAAAGLNLVMVTNEDGRQYKASELKAILEKIGFGDVKVISSPLTPYSVIIASKQ